uniref:PPM-type phosphatase domain-containing protein n=1 Tax=Macrostomum lignano TaxID=282301 RepID=A0A1I8GD08_9PLAT
LKSGIEKSDSADGAAAPAAAVHKSAGTRSDTASESALPEQWRACRLVGGTGRKRTLTLDCQRRGLFEVPADPPAGVTVVRLNGNILRDLRSVPLPGVTRLELVGCGIANIRQYALSQARSLQHLDLTNNELTSLSAGALSPLSSLQDLTLAQNQFANLPDLPCDRLPRLQSVNLAANDIASLRLPTGYSKCASLHSLTLSGNSRLTELRTGDLDALAGGGRLRVLRLAACPLTRLDLNALDPVRDSLQHLDLSGNRLSTKPMLNCLARLRNLRWLRLHQVAMASLRPGDLRGGLATLRSLQVTCSNAHGKLLTLAPVTFGQATKSIEQLQLDACGLTNFDYQVMGLSKLQSLDLADNKLTEVPRGLPDSLTHLGLNGNRISHVSGARMTRLANLRRLDLSGNRLSSVAGAFSFICWTPALAELELDSMELRVMEQRAGFDGPPPAFPARAAQLVGKKRKKLLRTYSASLLASAQAYCRSQPPPDISSLPADDHQPPNFKSNENSGDSSVALGSSSESNAGGLSTGGIAGLLRLRGSNNASAVTNSTAASGTQGQRRIQGNSRETLMSQNHGNPTYERINGQNIELSLLATRPLDAQQLLEERQQPISSSSPRDQQRQQHQQQQQESTSDSDSHESFDEDIPETARLSRAEGGNRSPSICSVRPTALLIGLSADLDQLSSPNYEAAAAFIRVDETTFEAVPEDLTSAQRYFIMLTKNLISNGGGLLPFLNSLLEDSSTRGKVKIIANFKDDTPEFGSQIREYCPLLHRIYLKY